MTRKPASSQVAEALQAFLDKCAATPGATAEGVDRQVHTAASMQQAICMAAIVDQLDAMTVELGLIRAELKRRE